MHLATEICELKGSLVRKSDSRYAVSVWYIPGGCDYVNAVAVAGFWSEEEKANAEAFQKKHEHPPELANLVDLADPRLAGLFTPKNCKHCFASVNFNYATRKWMSDKTGQLDQYCWVDPVKGSQLHEV